MNTDLYAHPQKIDDVTRTFPGRLGTLLPPRGLIPDDYPNRKAWRAFQSTWTAGKLPPDPLLEPTEGVDPAAAWRHLTAIQSSFEPKHEHKMDAVAWLASRWFLRIHTPDGSYSYPNPAPTMNPR